MTEADNNKRKFFESVRSTLFRISLNGRSDKHEYRAFLGFGVIYMLVLLLISIPLFWFTASSFKTGFGLSVIIPIVVWFLIFLITSIWMGIAGYCLGARRFHDFNLSAWWYFAFTVVSSIFSSVPSSLGDFGLVCGGISFLAGLAMCIVLCIKNGSPSKNKYGLPDYMYRMPMQ